MATAGVAAVEMVVCVAGGVVELLGAAVAVGAVVVIAVAVGVVLVTVVRRVVLVAAVLVPAVVDSPSTDGSGGPEVVVSDAMEFSSGEVTVAVCDAISA